MFHRSARTLGAGLSRVHVSDLSRLAVLVALLGLTTWNLLERPSRAGAFEALGRKDYRAALRMALDDLGRHPADPSSSLVAAKCLSALNYGDAAEPHYAVAEAHAPLTREEIVFRIDGLVRSNRMMVAAKVCRDELAKRPDDPAILIKLAAVEWLAGHAKEAQEAAERAAHTAEGRAEGLALLATVHHDAKHREHAVEACEALLAIDPELKTYRAGASIFWREFAEDLVALHRDAEARDSLLKVISPYSDPVLHDLLGLALRELGDLDGAEQAWRESARRDPKRLNPWLQLGRLANGRKRFAEAIESLDKALALDPDEMDVNYQLALAHRFLKHAALADRFAARAAALRPAPTSPTSGGMGAIP